MFLPAYIDVTVKSPLLDVEFSQVLLVFMDSPNTLLCAFNSAPIFSVSECLEIFYRFINSFTDSMTVVCWHSIFFMQIRMCASIILFALKMHLIRILMNMFCFFCIIKGIGQCTW